MIADLQARYLALSSRERLGVQAAAGMVAVALLVLIVVEPLLDARASWTEEVAYAGDDLRAMQVASARIGSGGAALAAGGNLLAQVDLLAQQRGLRGSVRRLQPEGQDGVRVTLEAASFDDVLRLIGDLRDQGVDLSRVDLQRRDDLEGAVDGSLSLRRGT